jgi:hypothetical protein
MKNDEVELSATSRNLAGNFTDSPKQPQLLQQSRRDSTADVPNYNSLPRSDAKHMSGIDAHIRATDDYCSHIRQRARK